MILIRRLEGGKKKIVKVVEVHAYSYYDYYLLKETTLVINVSLW